MRLRSSPLRFLTGLLALFALLFLPLSAQEKTPPGKDGATAKPKGEPGGEDSKEKPAEKPKEEPEKKPEEKPATQPKAGEVARITDFGSFTIHPPAEWVAEEPNPPGMRKAQYSLPAPPGKEGNGEFVVFFFGKGQGGSVESNIERWRGQFKKPEGMTDEEHVQILKQKVGDIPVTIVELRGDYGGMSVQGVPDASVQKDHMMLGAVIESEAGNYFFKTSGPRATIEHWKKAWYAMTLCLEPKKGA